MKTHSSADEIDRRNSDRYQWFRFESRVRVRRGFFKKEWINVVPFDFSRFGMGIQTDEQFEVGDEVTLGIELARDSGRIQLSGMQAVVRYKAKHHSRFNYGIEFVLRNGADKHAVDDSLFKIEVALRKFESELRKSQDRVVISCE